MVGVGQNDVFEKLSAVEMPCKNGKEHSFCPALVIAPPLHCCEWGISVVTSSCGGGLRYGAWDG